MAFPGETESILSEKELFAELTKRGKELEKIRKLVYSWKSQIPKALFERLEIIIDGYVVRNTSDYDQEKRIQAS